MRLDANAFIRIVVFGIFILAFSHCRFYFSHLKTNKLLVWDLSWSNTSLRSCFFILWKILDKDLLSLVELKLHWWKLISNSVEINSFKKFVVHDVIDIWCTNSVFRVFNQKQCNKVGCIRRNIFSQLVLTFFDKLKSFILRFSFEWDFTCKELVDHNTKCPKITCIAPLSFFKHFWWDIILRSN